MRLTHISPKEYASDRHLMTVEPRLAVTQTLGEKPIYHINDLQQSTGSRATAYRVLDELRELGFATPIKEGYFTLRTSLFQPYYLWPYLLPSLKALKQARYFGRSYNENDARLARKILNGKVTLDYRAYELTRLQEPHTLFLYEEDPDSAAATLKERRFWEGRRGRVAIIPHVGSFENELQRVYLDCIAYGGRNNLDAIAIELLYGEALDSRIRGTFRSEDVVKVREELDTLESRARSS